MINNIDGNIENDIEYTERAYTTSEVATMLSIAVPTVRKYAQTMEKEGYIFIKTKKTGKQQSRLFTEKDITSFRYLIQLREKSNIKVSEAVSIIINKFGKGAIQDIMPSDTEKIKQYDKRYGDFLEVIERQNDLIKNLSSKIDEQQAYMEKVIQERDTKIIGSLEEIKESQKQIESAEHQEKRGIFKRLFSK